MNTLFTTLSQEFCKESWEIMQDYPSVLSCRHYWLLYWYLCQRKPRSAINIWQGTCIRVFSKQIWLLGQVHKRAPVSFVAELRIYVRWYSEASRMNIKKTVLARIINDIGMFTKENQKGPILTSPTCVKESISTSLLGQAKGPTETNFPPVSTLKNDLKCMTCK